MTGHRGQRRSRRRVLVFACVWMTGLAWAASTASPEDAKASSGWTHLSRLLFRDAHGSFARDMEKVPTRDARLGQALAQLGLPPVTQGSVARAEQALQGLRDENGDDAAGIEASYALARLYQFHPFAPDEGRALALYDELGKRHPEQELGQQALVKGAMIRLFAAHDATEATRVFAELEAQVPTVTHPSVRCDFHLVLAGAAQMLGLSPERALEHLLAADGLGVRKRKTAADLHVRIATLAERLGRRETAIAHYRRFVDEFPRDSRTYFCRRLLRGLEEGENAE